MNFIPIIYQEAYDLENWQPLALPAPIAATAPKPEEVSGTKEGATVKSEPVAEEALKCASPGCSFQVTWYEKYCCKACEKKPCEHGGKCDQRPMPEPSDAATPSGLCDSCGELTCLPWCVGPSWNRSSKGRSTADLATTYTTLDGVPQHLQEKYHKYVDQQKQQRPQQPPAVPASSSVGVKPPAKTAARKRPRSRPRSMSTTPDEGSDEAAKAVVKKEKTSAF